MMADVPYGIKQCQLEKAIGELKALVALHYNPSGYNRERYHALRELVEKFEHDLREQI